MRLCNRWRRKPALPSDNSFIYRVSSENGKVLLQRKLYQPPIFISDLAHGVATLCFRLHLSLFDYHLEQLAIDHSSLFPSALLLADINNDGTKDIIGAGEKRSSLSNGLASRIEEILGRRVERALAGGGYNTYTSMR